MNFIGIMQGRLSPPPSDRLQAFPWSSWEREFPRARCIGFDGIEWIFEWEGFDRNPIWTEEGRGEISRLMIATGVQVRSVCADYFMVHRLAGDDALRRATATKILAQLIQRCALLGVVRILVPFLETSSIESRKLQDQAIDSIRQCLPIAEEHNVDLALEVDLPGPSYANLLERVAHPLVRAYYDTGNAAAQGMDIADDVRSLLPWLGAVHIKDRRFHGHTVPLGTGAANFGGFFRVLAEARYDGPFVLQPAFGADFEADACRHLEFVRGHIGNAIGEVL